MDELFPCYKCGLCCQNVDKSEKTKLLDRGDGTCLHYDEKTKLCSIYETRPEICNVKNYYQNRLAQHLSWNEFVELNLQACKEIQSQELARP